MPINESLKRAQEKYTQKKKVVGIRMRGENAELIKAAAEKRGMTVSAFANEAFREKLEKDGFAIPENWDSEDD